MAVLPHAPSPKSFFGPNALASWQLSAMISSWIYPSSSSNRKRRTSRSTLSFLNFWLQTVTLWPSGASVETKSRVSIHMATGQLSWRSCTVGQFDHGLSVTMFRVKRVIVLSPRLLRPHRPRLACQAFGMDFATGAAGSGFCKKALQQAHAFVI